MIVFVAVATFVLSGHVVDRTTGQPLPGVSVSSGSRHAKTNADGAYALRGLHAGATTIVLESDDVPPQSFAVTLSTPHTAHDFTACSTTLDYSCAPR